MALNIDSLLEVYNTEKWPKAYLMDPEYSVVYESEKDELFVVFPESWMRYQEVEVISMRKLLFNKYNIDFVAEIEHEDKSFGEALLYHFVKNQPNIIKIARCRDEKGKIKVNNYGTYKKAIEDWYNNDVDDPHYDFIIVPPDDFYFTTPVPAIQEKGVVEFLKAIEQENAVPLNEKALVTFPTHRCVKEERVRLINHLIGHPISYKDLDLEYSMQKLRSRYTLQKGDIIVSKQSSGFLFSLVEEDLPNDIILGRTLFLIRSKEIDPNFLYRYLISERTTKYLSFLQWKGKGNGNALRNLPVIIPEQEIQQIASNCSLLDKMENLSDQCSKANEILREGNIVKKDRPFQRLMADDLIEQLYLFKEDIIKKLLIKDFYELQECYENNLYKACIIMCGSIMEAVLLDWLSEKQPFTDFFKGGSDSYIELTKVINQIRFLQKNPEWNYMYYQAAMDVRDKRNLVHPAKCIQQNVKVDKNMCELVIKETNDVLRSRGLKVNLLSQKNKKKKRK